MSFITDRMNKRRMLKEKKLIFLDNLKNSGVTIAMGESIYLGGHPDVLAKAPGNITVKDSGLFFYSILNYDFFFIPAEKIIKCDFKNGELISKNEFFSRLLAMSGYKFAFDKNNRLKHMYLTVTYKVNETEITVLFETQAATKLVGAMNKILQENEERRKEIKIFDKMKELMELKALGIITEADYIQKKMELLSRI